MHGRDGWSLKIFPSALIRLGKAEFLMCRLTRVLSPSQNGTLENT